MCLPWRQFEQADLATSSIVEDIRLGIELTRVGSHPQLATDSFVWSPHAELGSTLAQRSRWEGGYLAMARATFPVLLKHGIRSMSLGTILSALDLIVPPLAMLALLDAGALLLIAACAALGWSSWVPVLLLVGVGVAVVGSLLAAWRREGLTYLPAHTLFKLPLYALWKVPMYLGLLTRGAPTEWRRTERPPGRDHEA
jgi:hypothetical protein